MQFTVSPSSVPAGTYSATFLDAEPFQDREQKYGEGVCLRFRIDDVENQGDEALRIVSRRMTPKSQLFRFAQALLGRELLVGETFDFAVVAGVRGLIVVEPTETGGTRVATFLRSLE